LYQDRLGTNIGKVEKRGSFLQGVGLTDHMVNATVKDDEVVPLGMMGVSWGGTLIEQVRKRYRTILCDAILY
jgi:hypothetical protein